jgi:lipoprotein-releasing system permease protein
LARRIAFNHGGQKNNVMIRIATLSVAIGMAVMIISLAVIFGFKHEITAKLTGFGAHVQIVNLDGNTSYETVPISINQPVVPLIEKLPDFGGIHPYAIKAGILRSDDAMQGVVLKGVAADYDWTFFQDNLIEGSMPRIGDTVRYKDILISRKLAAMLQLKVDDPLEMLFIQNPPRRDQFRVRGIYDTQFDELDKMMVLTDIRNVQRLNGWDSTQITGFEITTTDFSRLEPFTDAIDDLVFNTAGDQHPRTLPHHLRLAQCPQRQRSGDYHRHVGGGPVQHDHRIADYPARTHLDDRCIESPRNGEPIPAKNVYHTLLIYHSQRNVLG